MRITHTDTHTALITVRIRVWRSGVIKDVNKSLLEWSGGKDSSLVERRRMDRVARNQTYTPKTGSTGCPKTKGQ